MMQSNILIYKCNTFQIMFVTGNFEGADETNNMWEWTVGLPPNEKLNIN